MPWIRRNVIYLSAVVLMAKPSIYFNEITQTTGSNALAALMSRFTEQAETRKLMKVISTSIGKAGRKTLLDKLPSLGLSTIRKTDMVKNSCDAFVVRD